MEFDGSTRHGQRMWFNGFFLNFTTVNFPSIKLWTNVCSIHPIEFITLGVDFFFWIAVNKSIFTNFETIFWKTTTFFDWIQFVQMNEIELFGVNVSSLHFHTFISISFILQFYWQCINENEIQINSSSSIGANVYI